MKLPQSVRIGAVDYLVVPLTLERERELNASGHCDRVNKKISVCVEGRPPSAIGVTLLHECLHAMYWQFGLHHSLRDPEKHKAGTDPEEPFTWQQAEAYACFMRDNPEAVAFVMASFRGEVIE